MNIIASEMNTEVRLSHDCITCGLSYIFQVVFSSKETLVFLTVGEEKGPGLFLLVGPSELVAEFGPQ